MLGDGSNLEFAKQLQRARSFHELFEITLAEVKRSIGYQTIWFAVLDSEDADVVRVIDAVGAHRDWFYDVYDEHQLIPRTGDKLLEEVLRGDRIVVVDDARTDARTNKQIVEILGNRTIVNVPLAVIDKPLGLLGTGTFAPEEPRPPTPDQLAHLEWIASFISVAAARLRIESHHRKVERERRDIERQLAHLQRLDSIGVLAGGLAHDFNNLLTVVSAATALARRAQSREKLESELAAIEDVVSRGTGLTRQLLAVSRAQTLTLQDVPFTTVLDDVIPLVRRVTPESISIDVNDGAAGSYVEADRAQLDQVIVNLCLNARDAMTPSGGRLSISTEIVRADSAFVEANTWAKADRYLLLRIADTGHGIAKEHLDRIFEPFFTTKGERAGTGLGLSVTYGIVRQHEGVIRCRSEVGVGTTFEVYLPLIARQVRIATVPVATRVRGGDERILLADDDPAVLAVSVRTLEGAGYRVRGVANGRDVIRSLEVDEFDLVVIDIMMPGMACADLVARIRSLRADQRIVLSSGYTGSGDLVRQLQLPLLAKPFDHQGLLLAVRGALDSRPSR